MNLKNRCDLSLCARPGSVVCFFAIHEIEKQRDKSSDAPHGPPSPILFPDCRNDQRQTACAYPELWIPRSKCTSSDERNDKADSDGGWQRLYSGVPHRLRFCFKQTVGHSYLACYSPFTIPRTL